MQHDISNWIPLQVIFYYTKTCVSAFLGWFGTVSNEACQLFLARIGSFSIAEPKYRQSGCIQKMRRIESTTDRQRVHDQFLRIERVTSGSNESPVIERICQLNGRVH